MKVFFPRKVVHYTLPIKTKIIHSKNYNPYHNLALEEYLLQQVEDNEIILYLWQNQNTIVIGKNQNPWKECRISQVEKDGVHVARRLSGGGAVYHDLGNLNFTFLMKEKNYNLEKQLQVILEAVKTLGIEASFTGKNDITVHGRKFSGNAFYFGNKRSYHHGTLLIHTDMKPLSTYLQVSKEKIKSKGVDSIQSRVINLIELNPDITIAKVIKTLEESFQKIYGGSALYLPCPAEKEFSDLIKKYSSWKWRFGQSPPFDIAFENRFDFGGVELLFSLKNSHIQQVTIYSDSIHINIFEKIKEVLTDVPFDISSIVKQLDTIPFANQTERKIVTDIQEWLFQMHI